MSSLLLRIREMVSAHAHDAVDRAEDPHVMAQQVLRDLAEDLARARAALVQVLGAEKQLEARRLQLQSEVEDWEESATRMLTAGKEDLARSAVDKAVVARGMADQQRKPLEAAQRAVARLRGQQARLQQEWESARQRCAQITSNQAAATALDAAGRAGDHYSRAMDRSMRLDRLGEKAARFEAAADASAELLDEGDRIDRELREVDRNVEVEATLARLRASLATAAVPAS